MKKGVILAGLMLMIAISAFAAPKNIDSAIYEQPALITVIGQSADIQMVKVLFERNAVSYVVSPLAKPADLEGKKTLVLVIGGSSKGLGAAGIDAAEEAKRGAELIAAAKKANIKILAMHVGGESRRGDLTDRYIGLGTADAEAAIVVESGDADKIFAKAMEGKYLEYSKNIGGVGAIIKKVFK